MCWLNIDNFFLVDLDKNTFDRFSLRLLLVLLVLVLVVMNQSNRCSKRFQFDVIWHEDLIEFKMIFFFPRQSHLRFDVEEDKSHLNMQIWSKRKRKRKKKRSGVSELNQLSIEWSKRREMNDLFILFNNEKNPNGSSSTRINKDFPLRFVFFSFLFFSNRNDPNWIELNKEQREKRDRRAC